METTTCWAVNSTARILVDPTPNWWTDSSTPNPVAREDFQGAITHELGHALQAWGRCTDGDSQDPCHGMHYDTQYNGLICDSSAYATYSTMCQLAPYGDDYWRIRSLEEHDKDLVQGMY